MNIDIDHQTRPFATLYAVTATNVPTGVEVYRASNNRQEMKTLEARLTNLPGWRNVRFHDAVTGRTTETGVKA